MKVKLQNVRLAFPVLFEPKSFNGEGTPAFSASFIFGQDHPAVAALQAAIDTVGKEKWKDRWPQMKKQMEAQDRTALHDGDLKSNYTGFEGNLYVSSRNKSRPQVVDRDATPLVEADGKPYAGCYVNANIELWAQDNQYGKRINATLRGVQFLKDGDAFIGSVASNEDEFQAIADDELVAGLV